MKGWFQDFFKEFTRFYLSVDGAFKDLRRYSGTIFPELGIKLLEVKPALSRSILVFEPLNPADWSYYSGRYYYKAEGDLTSYQKVLYDFYPLLVFVGPKDLYYFTAHYPPEFTEIAEKSLNRLFLLQKELKVGEDKFLKKIKEVLLHARPIFEANGIPFEITKISIDTEQIPLLKFHIHVWLGSKSFSTLTVPEFAGLPNNGLIFSFYLGKTLNNEERIELKRQLSNFSNQGGGIYETQ